MTFNSLVFIVFFLIFYPIYYFLKDRSKRIWLLLGSYFFYGWWNPYYLILIIISTLTDFFAAKQIDKSNNEKVRNFFLFLSLFVNLSLLFTFKYADFFLRTINSILPYFSIHHHLHLLNFLLPVGISFYTFQTMGYTIDVYRRRIKAEHNLVNFSVYVSFFPQLVAGPIERAENLLPQIQSKIKIIPQEFEKGMYLVLWGYFLKVVVADNLAPFVDEVFANPGHYRGIQIIVSIFFFSFQIYSDFAGYTAIARGLAKMMGFELMLNFRQPYFATSIRNFWHRWHISLSTWFRDYVYIPLGGNRRSFMRWILAVFLTFLLSGLWHGANWTFVIWGASFGMLYIIEALIRKALSNNLRAIFRKKNFLFIRQILVFMIVMLLWLVFRSNDINEFFILFKRMLIPTFTLNFDHKSLILNFLLIGIVVIIDLFEKGQSLDNLLIHLPWFIRFFVVYFILWCIFFIGNWHIHPFIYFQF